MSNTWYILIFIVFSSCLNNKEKQSDKSPDMLTSQEKLLAQTFTNLDSLLTTDNGAFWGKHLYGPLIFVNPETRVFYSNVNNAAKSFKVLGSIYTDTLPNDINIANTALDWNNKRWSMVMLPLPTQAVSRNNLIIHELFHRLQPEIGFSNFQEVENSHLDTYNGRLLLKLELEALEDALKSNKKTTRINHIINALTFRQKRHLNIETRNAENSLELNEGLAEFTAIMLSGRGENDMKMHLIDSKKTFYSNPTFVRSFAYQTIPIYGYLLSSIKPNWHKEIDKNTNLSEYFNDAFRIDTIDSKSIQQIAKQNDYKYQLIIKEETDRENKRIEKIALLKAKFIESSTLELPFQNMNISFDPRNITPLENFGTVYPNIRITDNWGILTVENGALLAPNWSKVTVAEPTSISIEFVKGDGWQLELNPDWKVERVGYKFELLKK